MYINISDCNNQAITDITLCPQFGVSLWWVSLSIYVVMINPCCFLIIMYWDYGATCTIGPIMGNMTSSTKPEVSNVYGTVQ